MLESDENYYINNPIFVKFKKKFNLHEFRYINDLKSVYINERIIEIPFALECICPFSKSNRILDVGCTESPLALQLASLGYAVTGFDYRTYPYQHPNLKFIKGDVLKLPFRSGAYDIILAVSIIEHIGLGFYEDPEMIDQGDKQALDEIRRVMKNKGTLVLTVPYGVKGISPQQRVYDDHALTHLLEKFQIGIKRFFRNIDTPGNRLNTWIEVPREEIETVSSRHKTNGVCLVQATKKA